MINLTSRIWHRLKPILGFGLVVAAAVGLSGGPIQAAPTVAFPSKCFVPSHADADVGWGEFATGQFCDGTVASYFMFPQPAITMGNGETITKIALRFNSNQFEAESVAPDVYYYNNVGWVIRGNRLFAGNSAYQTIVLRINWRPASALTDTVTDFSYPVPYDRINVTNLLPQIYRQALWPDRATSPQIQNDPLLVIENGQDIRGRDEGSSSSVYEFRVRYQHPRGLPPIVNGLFTSSDGSAPLKGVRYRDGFNAGTVPEGGFKRWIADVNGAQPNTRINVNGSLRGAAETNGVAVIFGDRNLNITAKRQGIYHFMEPVALLAGSGVARYAPTSAEFANPTGVLFRWRWEPAHAENDNMQSVRPIFHPGSVDNRFGVGFENIDGTNFLNSVDGYRFAASAEYYPAYDELLPEPVFYRQIRPGVLDNNPDTGEPWDPRVAPNAAVIPSYPLSSREYPKVLSALWGVDWTSNISNWLYSGTISAGANSTRDLVNPDLDLVTRQGPFHPTVDGYVQMARDVQYDTRNESNQSRQISLLKNQVPVFYGTKAGEYVFKILYWGQNVPASIKVVVKNRVTNLTKTIPLTLTAVPGEIILDSVSVNAALVPTNAGDTYSAKVNLSDMVGSNEYYFEAKDGERVITFPVRNANDPLWPNSNVFMGPYVNNAPTISDISVAPVTATYRDKVTFKVTYKDPDKQRPQRYRLWLKVKPYTLVVNGSSVTSEWRSFIMNPVDPIPGTPDNEVLSNPSLVDWVKGVQFEYTLDATKELWDIGTGKSMTGKYFFEFMDSWGDPADPSWKNPLDYLSANVPGEVATSPAGVWVDVNNDNRINYLTTDTEIKTEIAAAGPNIQLEVKPFVVMPSTTVGSEIDWTPAVADRGGDQKAEMVSGAPRVAITTKYVQKNARAPRTVTVESAPMTDDEKLQEKWKDISWNPVSASSTVNATEIDTTVDYVNGKGYKALLPEVANSNYVYRVKSANDYDSVVAPWQPVTTSVAITEPVLGLKDAQEADVVAAAPISGDDTTTYTFRVVYKDTLGLGPGTRDGASVKLLLGIAKTPFVMAAVKADGSTYQPTTDQYIAGVIFQVKLTPELIATVGLGQHDYSFEATNGAKIATPLVGATKITVNQFSKLSKAGVLVLRDAETGAVTGYNFRVTFTDNQGNRPIGGIGETNVTVGGLTFPLDTEVAGANYVIGGMISKTLLVSELPVNVVVRDAYFRFGEGLGQLGITGLASLVKSGTPVAFTVNQGQLPVKFQVKYVGGSATDAPSANSIKVNVQSGELIKSYTLTLVGTAPTDWTKGAIFETTVSDDPFFAAGNYTFFFVGMDGNGLNLELNNAAFKFTLTAVPITTFDLAAGLDLVALPLVPSSTVLADVLGIDPAIIKAMSFTGNNNAPYAAATVADANSGYWVKPDAAVSLTLKGTKYDQTATQVFSLRKGWNLIGIQFDNGANLANATVEIAGATITLAQAGLQDKIGNWAWSYNKTSGAYQLIDGRNGATGALSIGRGYWMYSWVDGAKLNLVAGAPMINAVRSTLSVDWTSNIRVSSGDRSDTATIGVASQASRVLKPSALAEYVQVNLTSNGTAAGEDIRRSGSLTNEYTFEVITDQQNQPVTVQLEGIARLAGKYDVLLTDISGNVTRSLTGAGSYSFNSGTTGKRSFKMTVAPRSNQSPMITGLRVARTRGGVAQISFGLNTDATTSVEVMSVSGQLIRMLSASTVSKGSNTVTWDGRDQAGVSVPAGAYLVKVRAAAEDGNSSQAMSPFVVVR